MATMRFLARAKRDVDAVWKVISIPDTIAKWFPGVASSVTEGNIRRVRGGTDDDAGGVDDIIVTNDDDMRRFQYRVVGAEGHLATVDVLELGEADTLVIYSVELASEDLANAWRPHMEQGIAGLQRYLDAGGE
jgi:hypothetical protein